MSVEEVLRGIHPDVVKQMREEVIRLIPRMIYADPRSKLETLEDAFFFFWVKLGVYSAEIKLQSAITRSEIKFGS